MQTEIQSPDQTESVYYHYDNNGNLYSKMNEIQKQIPDDGSSVGIYMLGTKPVEYTAAVYEYDELDRLTKVSDGDKIVLSEYDAEDKRISKTVNGENEIRYVYDNGHVTLELDASNNITSRNVYGANLISRTNKGVTAYYRYNGNGDVVGLSNEGCETLAVYSYDAFGNITDRTGEFDNPYKYAGYIYDDETGLYYCNARYYDPVTARFISQDSVTGDTNDPLSLNRYTYCVNNPLKYNDPSGHWPNLKQIFEAAGNFINEKLIQPLANAASYSMELFNNNVIQPFVNATSATAESINNNMIQPAVNFVKENLQPIKTGIVATGLIVAGTAVIAASGGTAAPVVAAAVGGAMVGAGAEIGATMIMDYMEDSMFNYPTPKYVSSGIRGGISGGLAAGGGKLLEAAGIGLSAGRSAGLSLTKSSMWTGLSFMTGDAAAQLYENKSINYGQAVKYGAAAAVFDFAAGKAAPYLSNTVEKISNKISSSGTVQRLEYIPTNGVEIKAVNGRTTTVLGVYEQDTKYILRELGNVKSLDFGAKNGSFNMLNVPDELYHSPLQFWNEYNRPWLDNAIQRNDVIRLVTDPVRDSLTRYIKLTQTRKISGFGREYLYLKKNGYIFDSITKIMSR